MSNTEQHGTEKRASNPYTVRFFGHGMEHRRHKTSKNRTLSHRKKQKKALKPLRNQRFSSAPQEGLEPTTLRLTAECSAIELLRLIIRRRPTLPGRVQPSTIGAEGLNFCVRYGNRWDPFAIVTGNCIVFRGLRSAFAHRTCPRYPLFLWRLPLLTALASAFRAARPSRLRTAAHQV